MKIIQQSQFFNTFNEKGLSFNQWLDTYSNLVEKENTLQHYRASVFIQDTSKQQLQELKYKLYILAIVEDWCSDCRRSVR